MIYTVYRTPGPPLKWWHNAAGTIIVCGCIIGFICVMVPVGVVEKIRGRSHTRPVRGGE